MQRNAPGNPWYKTYHELKRSSDYTKDVSFLEQVHKAELHGDIEQAFLNMYYGIVEFAVLGDKYQQENDCINALFYFEKAHHLLNRLNYTYLPKRMIPTFESVQSLILKKMNQESLVARYETAALKAFRDNNDALGFRNLYYTLDILVKLAMKWEHHDPEHAFYYYEKAQDLFRDIDYSHVPKDHISDFKHLKKIVDRYLF